MKNYTRYTDIDAYQTKDGSIIRELTHPNQQGSKNQSLAEAIIPVDTKTLLHKHHKSEELYHITQGNGLMTLDEQQFEVSAGDTVCIPPGTKHCIENIDKEELKILCCCSPAYT